MKRLFLLLALVGMMATSCEDSGIEEPSNPTEQPDDNTDEEQPGDDDNTDEEQPGGDDNTDEEQPGGDDNTDEEQTGDGDNDDGELPVFEIDGPGKYTIGAEGGSVEVVVTTNLEYRLEVSEDAQSWLTIADTRAVRTERLTISVSPNNTDSERTATISVFDGADNKVFSFTLTQEYANDDNTDKPNECANNEILYTTKYGYPIKLSITEGFGGNMMSHTYENGLGKIVFDNDVTAIPDEAFKDCNSIVTITLPNCVKTIGDYAFSYCSSITSITIPDGVTTIGDEAFACCESLTSITIPDSITEIGDAIFADSDSLTEFTGSGISSDGLSIINNQGVLLYFLGEDGVEYIIPNGVTMIGDYAFEDCNSLTSVTIPDSVTTIGRLAFWSCLSLTSVYCKATTPPSLGFGVFVYNASGRKIYVPRNSVEAYKSATGWNEYAFDIVGYDF